MSRYVIDYAGRFCFPVSPEAIWSALEELDQFERWWPWLGQFAVDGHGLIDGTVLRGTVAPPVPYRMHVCVHLDRCVANHHIDATVHGDLVGSAHLDLDPDGTSTRVSVAWTIEMMQRPMRAAALVAYPVLRWGHDRVVDATVRGFRDRLQRRPAS